MFVHALVLFLTVDGDAEMRPGDAAADGLFGGHGNARDAKPVEPVDKAGLFIFGEQLEKGGGEHIARRAHAKIEIQRFHVRFLSCRRAWIL